MVEVGAPPSFTLESFYDWRFDIEWIPLNYVPISSLVSVRLATFLVTNEILMRQLFIYSAFVAMMFEPSTSHTRIWTATKDIMQRNVVPSHFCCLILFKYEAVPWCDFLYGTCKHFPGTPRAPSDKSLTVQTASLIRMKGFFFFRGADIKRKKRV